MLTYLLLIANAKNLAEKPKLFGMLWVYYHLKLLYPEAANGLYTLDSEHLLKRTLLD